MANILACSVGLFILTSDIVTGSTCHYHIQENKNGIIRSMNGSKDCEFGCCYMDTFNPCCDDTFPPNHPTISNRTLDGIVFGAVIGMVLFAVLIFMLCNSRHFRVPPSRGRVIRLPDPSVTYIRSANSTYIQPMMRFNGAQMYSAVTRIPGYSEGRPSPPTYSEVVSSQPCHGRRSEAPPTAHITANTSENLVAG